MTEDSFASLAAGWRQMVEIYQQAWSDAIGLANADPQAGMNALTTAYERMAGLTREAEASVASQIAGPPTLGEEIATTAERIDSLASRLASIEALLLSLAPGEATAAPESAKRSKKKGDGKKRGKNRRA